ncbi:MAG: TAXI family TRAP transporter solute-binding subunit [Clostridiales bacterium]
MLRTHLLKKTAFLVLIILICLGLLAGCGGSSPNAPAPTGNETEPAAGGPENTMPSPEQPGKLDVQEFVAGPANGGWSMVAAAIADKANAYFEGFPITATTGGAVANPVVMVSGEAQVGLTQGLFLNKLLAGEEPYDAASDQLKGIASLDSTALYFIVDASCPYDTLGELIESGTKMKVGVMPPSAASSIAAVMTLEEYGLKSFEEIQESGSSVYVAEGTALYDAYADRHFNMIVINKAIPDAATKEMLTGRDSKILGLDEQVLNSLVEKYGWSPMTIPAETYPLQAEEITSIGFKSVLTVRADVPEELAYVLAKVCYEEKAYLETVQAQYKAFDRKEMCKGTVVDMHPGALKYWQEMGLL